MTDNSVENDALPEYPGPLRVRNEPQNVDGPIDGQENDDPVQIIQNDIQAPNEDLKFKRMLKKISEELTDENLVNLKDYLSCEFGNALLDKIKKPEELSIILEERHWLTKDNLLKLQAALENICRMDLVKVVAEYAQTIDNVLCSKPSESVLLSMEDNSVENDALPEDPRPLSVRNEPQNVDEPIDAQESNDLVQVIQNDIPAPNEDLKFKRMLQKMSEELTDENLVNLKDHLTCEFGNVLLDEIKKPEELSIILEERHWLTKDNLLKLQAALRNIGRMDLVNVAAEYAQTIDNVLCPNQPSESATVLLKMADNSDENDTLPKVPMPVNVQNEPKAVNRPTDVQESEGLKQAIEQDFGAPTEDWGFKGMLMKLSKELNDENLKQLKYRFSGGLSGLGKGVQEKIKEPEQLFRILEERHWLTRDNLSILQAALRDIDRMDLVRVTAEYAQRMDNVLYFYEPSESDEDVSTKTTTEEQKKLYNVYQLLEKKSKLLDSAEIKLLELNETIETLENEKFQCEALMKSMKPEIVEFGGNLWSKKYYLLKLYHALLQRPEFGTCDKSLLSSLLDTNSKLISTIVAESYESQVKQMRSEIRHMELKIRQMEEQQMELGIENKETKLRNREELYQFGLRRYRTLTDYDEHIRIGQPNKKSGYDSIPHAESDSNEVKRTDLPEVRGMYQHLEFDTKRIADKTESESKREHTVLYKRKKDADPDTKTEQQIQEILKRKQKLFN